MVQTWEKLEALQDVPLLAEIHHQVAHVVTGFSLQGEAEGWSHCHAADKETHKRDTRTHVGVETSMIALFNCNRWANTGDSNN